jgi:hypothetical protein
VPARAVHQPTTPAAADGIAAKPADLARYD